MFSTFTAAKLASETTIVYSRNIYIYIFLYVPAALLRLALCFHATYYTCQDMISQEIRYMHPYFLKANPVLLKLMKRKQTGSKKKLKKPPKPIDSLSDAVADNENILMSPEVDKEANASMKSTAVSSDINEPNEIHNKPEANIRPIVSPGSMHKSGFSIGKGVCRRCLRVEHLFNDEDPFKSVFDIMSNPTPHPPEHQESLTTSAAQASMSSPQPSILFTSSATISSEF